nr:hypothetical protein [uncultured Roseateles sp.]
MNKNESPQRGEKGAERTPRCAALRCTAAFLMQAACQDSVSIKPGAGCGLGLLYAATPQWRRFPL